jgi:zinc protease
MRRFKNALLHYLLSALVLFSLAPPAPAQTAAGQATGGPTAVPQVTFEKYTLPNGLQVILHVDRKLPVVHVNQWFHVGSKNEKLNRTGFAHLFEHMMFQGSKNTPGEYFAYIEKAGANLFTGGVNGTTNHDRTNYFATVPSANLEYVLWLESDRLATLTDALTKEKLDNQRDVVKNERRQGLENQPYGRAFTLITENIFPKGHPYSWDVIGSHEDLTAASLDDVKEFFKTYYTPNNLSLVVAGDFDPAEAKRLVEKYFGSIPPGPALDRPARWIPKLDGERVIEVKDRVPQERVYISWPTAPFFAEGDADLDLAATVLSDGLSSRLNKVLVYDRQLASDVTAFQASREIASVFTVIATARPGASLSQIEQIITDEIARFAKSGPTAEELKRAQTKWEYRFVTGLERIGGFGGKSDLLNQYNTYWGQPGRFEDDLNRYRRATAESVRDAAARYLDTRNRLLVRFHPETSGRESQVAMDRSKEPPIGADRRFVAPEVKTARLENGMEIFVVERRELPKVAVSFVTKAGSVSDPRGREGVAHLTATTLETGTKTRKALEIEDALGDLGTSLQAFGGRESSTVSMEVLKRNIAPAFNLLTDVVRNPVFPAEEIDRERKLHLDSLAQEANNPNALGQRVGQMLIYGHEHPYGRPGAGLPATVSQVTRDDLARFHETYWKPGGSALVFAGDISLEEATALARQSFGTWAGGAPPAVDIPTPQPAGIGKVYVIDRQDAAQTVIMQMLSGPPRKTDDFYALNLADAVWGGGFGTRLNLNLRESKGYSYGVFSFPDLKTKSGAWIALGGVQTDKTKESLVEFISELKFLSGEKPITEKELADAKANRVRGYAQEFESLGQLVGQIATLWSFGLPFTELQRYPDETQRLTLAAVNAAAQKYAVPGKATLLLVGDLSKIGPGLRELNLGEIVVLDAEGRPVVKP